MSREELAFVADDGVQLHGTLTLPPATDPVPAGLVLSGSGPLDRDSNMPGQELNVGSALASALAAHGVRSLRFDKRGVGRSSGVYLTMGFEQETRDAASALTVLCSAAGVDASRVTVIGHSVGATIAMQLASTGRRLAGVVLLSASLRSGAAVMCWQSERIAASLGWPVRLVVGRRYLRRQVEIRERVVGSTEPVLQVDGVDLPALWLREFMAYDPTSDLRAIHCPVLAITGRKDVQVDADDVARIGRLVREPFSGETPEALTHVLRRHAGRPGLGSYGAQLQHPVDPELFGRVAAWTKAR